MTPPDAMLHDLGPGLRRLRAPNPSPMTGSGTNSYILTADGAQIVIDPGPALPAHEAALQAALNPDLPVLAILVTHAHLDHSAAARRLAEACAAPVLAFGPAGAGRSPLMQRLAEAGLTGGGEGVDHQFSPDRLLRDGDRIALGRTEIEVLHTPGHMGGHLCFGWQGQLFSGDHVMGWSTSLVSPPDGDMGAYMDALARLTARVWQRALPGHGPEIAQPAERIAELLAHRRAREAAILQALSMAPATPAMLAQQLYTDTPPALLGAAARNILAHLIDLHARTRVSAATTPGPETIFHLI